MVDCIFNKSCLKFDPQNSLYVISLPTMSMFLIRPILRAEMVRHLVTASAEYVFNPTDAPH